MILHKALLKLLSFIGDTETDLKNVQVVIKDIENSTREKYLNFAPNLTPEAWSHIDNYYKRQIVQVLVGLARLFNHNEKNYQEQSRELLIDLQSDINQKSSSSTPCGEPLNTTHMFTSADLHPLENYIKSNICKDITRQSKESLSDADQVKIDQLSPASIDIGKNWIKTREYKLSSITDENSLHEMLSFHNDFFSFWKAHRCSLCKECYPLVSVYYPCFLDCIQVLPDFFAELNGLHLSLGLLAGICEFTPEVNLRTILAGLKLGRFYTKKSVFFVPEKPNFILEFYKKDDPKFRSPFDGMEKDKIILTINRELSKDGCAVEEINKAQYKSIKRMNSFMQHKRLENEGALSDMDDSDSDLDF